MQIDEDVKEFLIEGYEHLNQIEGDLVVLEQSNADSDLMNRIYRNLHTIKGNSGFLGLERLQLVTHAGENLLSRLRDRTLSITPDITSALLLTIDSIRQHFEALEATGDESQVDESDLIALLNQLQEPSAIAPPTLNQLQQPAIAPPTLNQLQQPAIAPPTLNHSQQPAIAPPPPLSPSPTPPLPPSSDNETSNVSVADTAIRVDVGLLDKLMNLVGELVLCRNQILEFVNTAAAPIKDDTFKSVSGRLNLVTSELQEGVMKTRMQPIRMLWNKFPRVVRDLAINLGKQVRLEMEGEETELDKTLIEAIANPLTHLIRNSLDHGLETPDLRSAARKPAVGKIFLRAYHESGQVTIEVGDDGKGIDPEKIKQKAIQKGIITAEKAAQMSDREAYNLIFVPGFSTAEQVTNLSGRGVGMDVVMANVEKINGSIDVQSRFGFGTTFKLKIPLTLAIIPTLIITSGGDRFAIPQANLLELVRLEVEQVKQSIEMFHNTPVYRLRGRLLPLIYLNKELELDTEASDLETDLVMNIVVVQAADKPFGLVVDTINDTQEIVVKPLGKQLRSLSFLAGATIMGDGKVALILDIHGIAERTQMLSEQKQALSTDSEAEATEQEETQRLLLFQGPDRRRMAVPLAYVCRLEEILPSILERVGNQNVIQYRNQIMPLIYLSKLFGSNWEPNQTNGQKQMLHGDESLDSDEEKLPIVVVTLDGEKQVGLVVERILDIVEQVIEVQGSPTQAGIAYCAVIQNQVTEIINLEAVIRDSLFTPSKVLVPAN